MASSDLPILVTGATGFIGAHVVDNLLARGLRVRGATRTQAKGDELLRARPQYADKLEVVVIDDFEKPGRLTEAVEGVGGLIHVASPFTFDVTDNEKELIVPAINGVRGVLDAASKNPNIKRVVITSSFASVVDIARKAPPFFTYTGTDWNPLTYAEAADSASGPVVGYRGSKKFAELAAWKFVEETKPAFDIVTLCPAMVFGPVVHPVASVDKLNESSAVLWDVVTGVKPLPTARVPFWIDVRDLAAAHVEAFLRSEVGGKRYTLGPKEGYSYGLAASIIADEFPQLRDAVNLEEQPIDESHGLDGETAAKELGITYHTFRETVKDFVSGALKLKEAPESS